MFVPERINSPEPFFTKFPDPLITPDSVWADEDEYCKVPLLIILLDNFDILWVAPLNLKDPVFCKFSNLKKTSASNKLLI